jgi:hypothetical protein
MVSMHVYKENSAKMKFNNMHQTKKKKALGWTSSYISYMEYTCLYHLVPLWSGGSFIFYKSCFGKWVEFEKMSAFSRFSALFEIVPFDVQGYWVCWFELAPN